MPRKPEGTWVPGRRCFVASLGERYTDPKGRERRRQVVLRHEDGTPVGQGDEPGRLAALARLMAACEAEDRARGIGARPPEVLTVADMLCRWVHWHRDVRSSPRTIRQYAGSAKSIADSPWKGGVLGNLPAAEFRDEHLFAVRAYMRSRSNVGGVAVVDARAKVAFRWAAQAVEGRDPIRLLKCNPFPRDSVKGLPMPRSDRPCPSWEELLAILDRLDARASRPMAVKSWRRDAMANALAIRVLATRGCRPLEVVQLRVEEWRDGAAAGHSVGFALGSHKTSLRTGVPGVIPLDAQSAARVRAVVEDPDRIGPWVWWPWLREDETPHERRLTQYWGRVRGAVGGGDYTLYSFRNTVSNRLRTRGVEGRLLQLALRHTTKVADTVYRCDVLEDAADVFGSAGM